MRFAVLASPESWYLRDLTRAAADRHQIVPITFRELTAKLGRQDPAFSRQSRFNQG